jgi:hypothetical protein
MDVATVDQPPLCSVLNIITRINIAQVRTLLPPTSYSEFHLERGTPVWLQDTSTCLAPSEHSSKCDTRL